MQFDINIFLLFGILDWVIRIFALFVVPRNRKPSSATAWLMLILLLPIVGILIYFLLGSPKLNRRRRAMQKHMDDAIAKTLQSDNKTLRLDRFVPKKTAERFEPLIHLNQALSGFPAFQGNSVELIDEYDDAIRRIAKDIDASTKFVHIEYFIIALDNTTKPLFKSIEQAIKRGVVVRVMFDAFGSKRYPGFQEMKEHLTRIGVEWHPMLPLKIPGKKFNRPDLRNHRKIVVVDGEVGYTGSQNLVTRNYHRKDNLYYDELVARVTGPVVLQLEAAFMTDWYSETQELLLQNASHPQFALNVQETGDVLAQVLPSGPGFDNDNNLKLFTSLIHTAKQSITIVNPYFVPDDSLTTAITSAAQRGVTVTMVNSEIMDQKLVGHAQRSYYEELLRAGVKIFLYDSPILLHSKYMTIDDDIAVIGSSNLDMRSFQLDLEVTLVAYDTKTVQKLDIISQKYIKKSHPLHLSEWMVRPLRTKLFENLARLTSAVQ